MNQLEIMKSLNQINNLNQLEIMKSLNQINKPEIVHKIHIIIIIYLLTGWIIESQRKYLVLLLPTLQYQFLINDNQCILTQLENYLLKDKGDEDIGESFIDKKLKQMNINLTPRVREYLIHSAVYGSFIVSYFFM